VSKLGTLVAIPLGLGLVKLIVDRTQDEPNTPNIIPNVIEFTEGQLERAKKGFGL